MDKLVKIGGQSIETLAVEIGDTTYQIPLARSMKRKELLALTTDEAVYDMFAKHIPPEVLDDMTLGEYEQLVNAWVETNQNTEDASLGES